MALFLFLILITIYITYLINKNSSRHSDSSFYFGMTATLVILFGYVFITGLALGSTQQHNIQTIESPETGYLIRQWDQTCTHSELSNWLIFNYCGPSSSGPRAKILTQDGGTNSDPITID